MTRTCSKGMFNDFFGQWNAHVHCWCNTNKKIRKLTTWFCVSIPSSTSVSCLMLTKDSKWSRAKMSGVSRKDWPVGGEPALTWKNKTKKKLVSQLTLVHEYLLCPVPLMHPWHLCFHLRKLKHGKHQSRTQERHECRKRRGIAYLEWADANTNKLCWKCAHRWLNSWAD